MNAAIAFNENIYGKSQVRKISNNKQKHVITINGVEFNSK